MLLEDVDPEHRCDLQTLRATTRFDAEELQSVLSEMGDRAAGIETRCVRRRLTCGIGALAEYPGSASEVPQLSETDQVVTALPGELSSATFDATLTRGIPLRIQGMQHRLQGEWTPTAMSEAVTDVDIDCIDCNSDNEETTPMPASTFFARLAMNAEPDVSQPVYKVKASLDRLRDIVKPRANLLHECEQDWPPDTHFKHVFTRQYVGYNNSFPPECADTIRLDGVRNLAAVWPDIEGAPDLGENWLSTASQMRWADMIQIRPEALLRTGESRRRERYHSPAHGRH